MAVFRIEKNSDFTIMPNYPFRDMRLSFKGRGLLGTMLTLRDDWDYTLAGLTAISPHGKSYVSTGLNELERLGYLERRQLRDEQGRFIDTEYVIYEVPRSTSQPDGNPETASPSPENPPQLNTKFNQEPKNKKLNESRTHSIPSSAPRRSEDEAMWREIILENIEYDLIIGEDGYDRDSVDEAVEQIVDAVSSSKDYIRVGGESRSADVVRSRLLKLNRFHVEFVLDCTKENTTRIRNIRQYLLTALYNAPASMESYYAARVRHDMRGGDAG
uniref:DUF6017 domain-containing protein n=1 Tax=Candidatus Scatomorpha intestinigallinarum TaxID=2840923 RepID=UPI004025DCF1